MSGNNPNPNFIQDIIDFHEKFGLAYEGKPRMLPTELADFRHRFMEEELREWIQGQNINLGHISLHGTENHPHVAYCLEQQLDALVDLMYVLLGTAYLQGLLPYFGEAWARVQAANMSKVRTERAEDSKRGSTFDVVKPDGWEPPNHSDLVADHAHQATEV